MKLTSLSLSSTILKKLREMNINTEEKPPALSNTVWYNADDDFFHNNSRDRKIVESFIIQAYRELRSAYSKCQKSQHQESGRIGRYMECRTLEGLFKGICGNCKRSDHGRECSHGEDFIGVEQARVIEGASRNQPRATRNSQAAARGGNRAVGR